MAASKAMRSLLHFLIYDLLRFDPEAYVCGRGNKFSGKFLKWAKTGLSINLLLLQAQRSSKRSE
jgi:hypothetical protein